MQDLMTTFVAQHAHCAHLDPRTGVGHTGVDAGHDHRVGRDQSGRIVAFAISRGGAQLSHGHVIVNQQCPPRKAGCGGCGK